MEERIVPTSDTSKVSTSAKTKLNQESSQTKSQSSEWTQGKNIYQPKYLSLRAQQRRRQQVLVPKQMVQAQKLSDGDQYKWVECQATQKIIGSTRIQ